MTNVNDIRHPKETGYFTVMAVVSGLIWLPMIPAAIVGFFISIPFLIVAWLSSLYFKAVILGDSVRVSADQYPEIYQRANEISRELKMTSVPEIFVVNSNGVINAVAYRVLDGKYIFVYSSLVDLLLIKGHRKELDFILGHELGHYAAGHMQFWKRIFLFWGKLVPFVGAAYSRACELTADRIGHHFVDDTTVSKRALAAMALGSATLLETISIEAFKAQEAQIPSVIGFIHKIFSQYPRTTRRVIEIEEFEEYNRFLKTKSTGASTHTQTPPSAPTSEHVFCSSCGTKNLGQASFCENCGHKLK